MVDMSDERWDVRKGNLEALFDVLENLLIVFAAHEGDGQALGTETAGTSNTVQVGVGIRRQVVVDGKVDALDIDTTPEHIGGDTDTRPEFLELLVPFDTGWPSALLISFISHNLPLLLGDTGVHSNTGEFALVQQLVQLVGTESALDEDDDLVEV